MSLQVEKLEKNMAKLTIEASVEDLGKAIEQAYAKNKSKISVPGFRKGKVPLAMVEKMYGVGIFYEEAANQLISTEKSIIEIAFCVGYTSQQAFTFAFKQKFLCTPQTFRKNFYICEMKKTFQINRNNRNAFFMLKNGGMTA